jgi:hypothetical protein
MSLISKFQGLFRRKPMTEEELRMHQEAQAAADQLRGLKSSQLSSIGQYDASARGGKGRY